MNTSRRDHQLGRLRRFLSKILRHRSTKFPVTLDAEGYADVRDIMYILKRLPNFRWVKAADVEEILGGEENTHYELVKQGRIARVRARYGHTSIRPNYPPAEPPDVLYVCADAADVDTLRENGLHPTARSYVHLAASVEVARTLTAMGSDNPAVLRIDAAAAHAVGIAFYQPSDDVYLADSIPAEFVSLLF